MTQKKNKKEDNKTIKVAVLSVVPTKFYIQDLEGKDASKLKYSDLEFTLGIGISLSAENKAIRVNLELDAYLMKNDQKTDQKVFGIKSENIFKTTDFDDIVNDKKELRAPQQFVIKLLNISIGGLRGMVATKLLDTDLKHITLPLFDLSSMDMTQFK